jgi:hypothetical protein
MIDFNPGSPNATSGMEERTMKTIAITVEALMRLVVFAAIVAAMVNQARTDKRAARAGAKATGR